MQVATRWGRPWAMAAFAVLAYACGSDETRRSSKPDASTDASSPDTGPPRGTGGKGGASGAGGTAGVAGMMMGTGCALGADAASDLSNGGASADVDASMVMDGLDAGTHDAGASIPDGAAPPPRDAGTGPVTYPPLRFADIGKVSVVSNQFLFTEGPVWDPASQVLFFTDINADAVYKFTPPDKFEIAVDKVGNADGLALDAQGRLLGAGFVARDVWRLEGGKVRSLVSEYRGRKLNTPDDVAVRSDGVIYFTDPTFGIDGSQGFSAQQAELCFQGVYRLTDSAMYLEDSTSAGPNGVNFSPDESILYVSYTGAGQIFKFTVAADGSLHDKTLFGSALVADSMCVDAGGNVYVASLGGITVFDPSGKQLGVIATNNQVPTNCAFGGPDQRTFFITARTGLIGAPTKGNSSLLRIDDMPIPGTPGRN